MLKHCHFEVINVCLYTHKMSDRSVMNEEKQPKKDLNMMLRVTNREITKKNFSYIDTKDVE